MSQATDQKIGRIDAVLQSLQQERSRCTDPADILRVSESIDVRLDERLRLMHARDGHGGGDRRASRPGSRGGRKGSR